MDALLCGCGGVSNGWAYAVRRLPIRGALDAVDKQSLRKENFGPYVLSSWAELTKPKALVLKKALEPRIIVTPRSDPLEFYKIRLTRASSGSLAWSWLGLTTSRRGTWYSGCGRRSWSTWRAAAPPRSSSCTTRAGPGFVC